MRTNRRGGVLCDDHDHCNRRYRRNVCTYFQIGGGPVDPSACNGANIAAFTGSACGYEDKALKLERQRHVTAARDLDWDQHRRVGAVRVGGQEEPRGRLWLRSESDLPVDGVRLLPRRPIPTRPTTWRQISASPAIRHLPDDCAVHHRDPAHRQPAARRSRSAYPWNSGTATFPPSVFTSTLEISRSSPNLRPGR